MDITARRQGKSLVMFNYVRLALAKGRSIIIGTADPALRYEQLRKEFPDAIMVVDKYSVMIKGKKNG